MKKLFKVNVYNNDGKNHYTYIEATDKDQLDFILAGMQARGHISGWDAKSIEEYSATKV